MRTSASKHLVFACLVFLLGFVTEIISVHIGLWSYPHPDVFGIPYWIPFGWVAGGYVVVCIWTFVRSIFHTG